MDKLTNCPIRHIQTTGGHTHPHLGHPVVGSTPVIDVCPGGHGWHVGHIDTQLQVGQPPEGGLGPGTLCWPGGHGGQEHNVHLQ